jgi:hypothetical protein
MTPFDPPYLPITGAKTGRGFERVMVVGHSIPHILLAEENPSLRVSALTLLIMMSLSGGCSGPVAMI